jgi:hypothetical protein
MFKYRYDYKYLKIDIGLLYIIIELSKDNSLGKMTYSAKTNLMFQDEYGDWGHAVGVGQNEDESLTMCIREIKEYLKREFTPALEVINIPQKIVYDYKNNTVVLNIKENNGEYYILTPNGQKSVGIGDPITIVSKQQKEFLQFSIPEYSKELFDKNDFGKPFDAMTEKYPPEENFQFM